MTRHFFLAALLIATGTGCDFTDAATRLAADLKSGSSRLAGEDGASYRIEHQTPSKRGECTGSYTVQLDEVGALIVWCRDAGGETVSSHSTSSHASFVETPETWVVDKPAGSTLIIDLERRGGKPVITDVR